MTTDPPLDAVLLIDLQNAFCAPDGSLAPDDHDTLAVYHQVINQAHALAEAARARGIPIMLLRHVFRPGYPEAFPTMPFLQRLRAGQALVRDSWDTQFTAPLIVDPTDVVIDKCRFDGFLDTDLDSILRARGARRLIVGGVSTNVCVESTVRSGAERGYHITVAEDVTAATTPELHHAALASISYAFATVQPWRALLPV